MVITIILCVTLVLILMFLGEIQAMIYYKYRASPPGIDCDTLTDIYSENTLVYMAGIEYLFINHSGPHLNSENISQTGALPCLCKYEAAKGNADDHTYEFYIGPVFYQLKLCEQQMQFVSMLGVFKLLGYVISTLIVVQSFLARFGFIHLTRLIKFTSNSQRMRFIIISVFCIFFFNYGVMYVLGPMELKIPIASQFLLGIYTDFN